MSRVVHDGQKDRKVKAVSVLYSSDPFEVPITRIEDVSFVDPDHYPVGLVVCEEMTREQFEERYLDA